MAPPTIVCTYNVQCYTHLWYYVHPMSLHPMYNPMYTCDVMATLLCKLAMLWHHLQCYGREFSFAFSPLCNLPPFRAAFESNFQPFANSSLQIFIKYQAWHRNVHAHTAKCKLNHTIWGSSFKINSWEVLGDAQLQDFCLSVKICDIWTKERRRQFQEDDEYPRFRKFTIMMMGWWVWWVSSSFSDADARGVAVTNHRVVAVSWDQLHHRPRPPPQMLTPVWDCSQFSSKSFKSKCKIEPSLTF